MDYQDIIITCRNCETKVPMSKTKFDKSGHVLICFDCYNRIYGKNNEKIIQAANPDRINYSCLHCGYEFSRNKSTPVNCCPYCANQKLSLLLPIRVRQPDKRLTDY